MPAARHIRADSQAVAQLLQSTIDLVSAHGATLHPDLVFVEHGGDLRVECRSAGGQLLTIPEELLVATDDVTWDLREGRLVITSSPALTSVQQEILDLHLALYNAADKVATFRAASPQTTLAHDDTVAQAIRTVRPSFRQAITSHEVARAFVQSRLLGLKKPRRRVLMPLGDLLNHHPKGSPLAVRHGALRISVAHGRPGSECFVSYGGYRDVLDLALHYAYLDHNTTLVNCPPLTIDIGGLGRLTIAGQGVGRARRLPAPRIAREGTDLTVSHLVFDPDSPETWQVPLRMALTMWCQQLSVSESLTTHVPGALVAQARGLLESVHEVAVCASSPRAKLLVDATAAQIIQLDRVSLANL